MTPFEPDTMLVHEVVPSPNYGERAGDRLPDMILLHYTGMPDGAKALERLCTAGSEVSCHYFVAEDGRIIQCVPESRRAWHAGEGSWAGDTDINSCSIGIEIVNPGHDNGYPDFPKRQIAAVTALCRAIVRRHHIRPERVLGHSDIAPSRKQDPGEKFPWMTLHRSGIGQWVKPAPIVSGPTFEFGDSGDAIQNFQTALRDYGYGIEPDGYFDQATRDVVTAFQRHFRPALCDGKLDTSTLLTLRSLIEANRYGGAAHSADEPVA
ncbi:N-acetylmuramoyl-L-alanine amidase [Pseudorhodoplanes sp.]|uniref:N-acetylmuramoyl-L-alanine amidase n=1 Tax=Pseudorhodoplanes sp. TaxID=1934341 RepID=UPI002C774EFE|nr:N-acetylmuramoyl-L-alanine amidase [Pseudorhodoplanes sp.]HWV54130.1 N-acetylmuramoyl-L-alanine amidase [Pseudorhodoplanes sp.]